MKKNFNWVDVEENAMNRLFSKAPMETNNVFLVSNVPHQSIRLLTMLRI